MSFAHPVLGSNRGEGKGRVEGETIFLEKKEPRRGAPRTWR